LLFKSTKHLRNNRQQAAFQRITFTQSRVEPIMSTSYPTLTNGKRLDFDVDGILNKCGDMCEKDLKLENSSVNQDSASPNLETQVQRDEEVDFADESESEHIKDQSTGSSDDEAQLEIVNNDHLDYNNVKQQHTVTQNKVQQNEVQTETEAPGFTSPSAQHLCVLLLSGLIYFFVGLSIVCTDCVCGIYRLTNTIIGNKDMWTTINKYLNKTTILNTIGLIQQTAGPKLAATSKCIVNTALATKKMITSGAVYNIARQLGTRAKKVLSNMI
jgi:hypothetical protein